MIVARKGLWTCRARGRNGLPPWKRLILSYYATARRAEGHEHPSKTRHTALEPSRPMEQNAMPSKTNRPLPRLRSAFLTFMVLLTLLIIL
ncbi:hypothetical protein, partial [Tateyamaria sp. syn59]|uniref:hypothetical protein n=1 Tax=Tateyamaria sp. syn59 TaxID=2576942 RepID=UPI001CB96ACE